MNGKRFALFCSLALIGLLPLLPVQAENAESGKPENHPPAPSKAETPAKPKDEPKEPKDNLSKTEGSVTINGVAISYTATAGTLVLKNEKDEKPRASFFFVAYTRKDATNLSQRPVTFSFNGGPGSSSVWMHLGLLGPKRVFLKDDGSLPPPPFHLVNNDFSLLDETDLVFIDPVSTGYSRPAQGEDARQFHGVETDIESVGEFIRLYTTRYERWNSPKFLIGESYGTTRAAGLAGHLENRYGMYLNGIMLISSVLHFQTISFNPGNDLPYILYLPTETATAWYHKKLPPDLQGDRAKALAESERFALGDYASALLQGAALPPAQRQHIVQTLARLTGVSEDYVDRANLRLNSSQYSKELLRDQRRIVGRYDSRLLGEDRNAVGDSPEYDPSFSAALGPFTATLNDYVRRDLKFDSDLPYEILNGRMGSWDFDGYKNRYLDVADTLREAMTHNPYLKVFIASGVYDMATPYLATKYTADHMELPVELRTNLSTGQYSAGHMLYLDAKVLVQLKADLAGFIRAAAPRN
jgi:carboxypeptidase C (cathepsin A)